MDDADADAVEEIIVFEKRGGIRWGSTNATWPFVKLRISPTFFTISAVFNLDTVVFQKKSISSLQSCRGWMLSSGIAILHHVPEYPEKIIFWDTDPRTTLEAFAAQGYPVEF